ncbi:hypothetical protein DY000_02041641 [Brassica cretica]|uniref:Uncharacterized protein n=1 Tax=Brassica cretica TaxID=69181 RepID=A0ABQ7BJ54_BRACR|nr:hypothetical protein DY000_02041641 [Brassica cretica]
MAKLKLTQLGTVGGQLISAWKSVPVWTSVAGSERLPGRAGGSCWTMGPCAFRLEPGLGQRPGEWFSMGETAKGAVGPDRGGYGRKGTKEQVATPCPIVCNCPAREVIGSLSIYTEPWGRFWASISLGKTLKKPCEKEEEREAGDLKRNRLCGA